jgi:endonuclease YncB( thermonuclease family)
VVGGVMVWFLPLLPVSSALGFSSCRWFWQQNCVIDGDTIRYQGERVRLVGIDAPEIFSPKCDYELQLGRKAKARLIELLNAGPFVVRPTTGPDVDQYGRKLREVTRNGRSIGDTLVAEGVARPWRGSRLPWC